MNTNRRTFLKVLGGAAAAASAATMPLFRAFADDGTASNEFYIFIHAQGGWDVTVGLDPRNEARGLVNPASTDNTDTSMLTHWTNAPLEGSVSTFQIIQPSGSNLRFGPGIGEASSLYDRMCVFNGLSMNTVSHPDGTYFATTGRHLAGGRPVNTSIDTMVANEFGRTQLFPVMSVQYPSTYLNGDLDRRAMPLRMGTIDTVSKAMSRSTAYDSSADRNAVTVMLTQEANDLAAQAYHPEVFQGLSLQYQSLQRMLGSGLQSIFSATALQRAHPEFDYRSRYQGHNAVNAAFAIEAMKRNVVRCVSFVLGGLDTHNTNYRYQAQTQQELFNVITTLVRSLDSTPHPTVMGDRLSDHTHILVVSDFCRTPQINLQSGRDHYPNGSALVISPRFRTNMAYGSSDAEQLLPANAGMFTDGMRPVAPPDVLATFLGAFHVDPRKYLRDGEVVQGVLRP